MSALHARLAALATAAALVLAALAAPAAAQKAPQTAADLAKTWGLIGTWASNCTAPASRDNSVVTYAALPNGHVSYAIAQGDRTMTYDISEGRMLEGNMLEVTYTVGVPEIVMVNAVALETGRLRIMWSFNKKTNEYGVANGVITGNNNPTRSAGRCS
jgi:hypothetical protein